jgi:hypothetical protein
VAGYYSATQQHHTAAPLADFLTAAYNKTPTKEKQASHGF